MPDEKKGERLVVLHTLDDDKLAPVLEKLAACDLPNLWKPRPDQFFHIDVLPYLGTGKLDLRKVTRDGSQSIQAIKNKKMERAKGFEPSTFTLAT